MARTVLSLALLACLGLAVLQLVSAEQEQQELEATSNEAVQAKAEEVQFRILREADAKKKKGSNKRQRNNKKKGTKKGKGRKKGRKGGKNKNKKPSNRRKNGGNKGNGKNRRQLKGKGRKKDGKKGKGKNGRRLKGKNNGSKKDRKGGKGKKTPGNSKPEERQAACDAVALCKQIKNYIKFSNQLRKLRRINRTCSTMEKKRDKAGGGEFSASAESNADSGNDTVNGIADELKNCTATAKANCETKEIPACTNLTLNNKCDGELDAWIKQFGPAKGSCLQSAADCCACINAITPLPSDDCLSFDALDVSSKDKKKKCTGSGTKGSFGYCRTLQQNISSEGPKAHKKKCGSGSMTTAAAAGRRKVFRNSNLIKKWIKS